LARAGLGGLATAVQDPAHVALDGRVFAVACAPLDRGARLGGSGFFDDWIEAAVYRGVVT